ncbi:alanine aminotransferase 2-like [Gossypium australe]|uniref:Alanine aminotransferase 2-like n=1 Tax=Gossypium australe TaxID=47621 RepID=A0A5B6WEJ4_9ROSI|nr:alanine aminotransferase 2-like [Gossypium australe]
MGRDNEARERWTSSYSELSASFGTLLIVSLLLGKWIWDERAVGYSLDKAKKRLKIQHHNHFYKVEKVLYRIFSENYSPLKEIVATPRRDDIMEEKWMMILQNLQEEDVEWRAPWMVPDEVLYQCGDFDWAPLLGIWRAVGYAPLLVLRQYRSRQFTPATQGLAQCEFVYK